MSTIYCVVSNVDLYCTGAFNANRYYEDTELRLVSLAKRLKMPPHELSKVINTALKKASTIL